MKDDSSITNEAFEVEGADRTAAWIVTCDHATNIVPGWVNGGELGLPPKDMARHIALDVGAAGVTRHLAKLLNAPAVLSCFSRLVIDPNRGADDPTLITQLYDGTIVPGNRNIDGAERDSRKTRLYDGYHNAIEEVIRTRQPDAIYLAIHSFTPRLNGKHPRPWHVTVLHADDDRFAAPLLSHLAAEDDLITAGNEPYTGALKGDSVDQHALRSGRPNALIEIRQDLIETPEDQTKWAERLAPILEAAREDMQM